MAKKAAQATAPKTGAAKTGRGSPSAIEKRRVARLLNTVLLGVGGERRLDGRTEKRRKRLLRELKEGRGGQPLKPLEVVMHVNELLHIGETLTAIRKNGVKLVKKLAVSDQVVALVKRVQAAYNFRPEAWRILGVQIDGAKRGRPKKHP